MKHSPGSTSVSKGAIKLLKYCTSSKAVNLAHSSVRTFFVVLCWTKTFVGGGSVPIITWKGRDTNTELGPTVSAICGWLLTISLEDGTDQNSETLCYFFKYDVDE
jgi:hypothetical protein